jgi:beta-phosphoglucomutase-like phosphatase (HAD superfamily)
MYKKIIEGKKVVLFDMDGTLLQSEGHWQEALNTVAFENDVPTSMLRYMPSGVSVPVKWEKLVENEKLDKDPKELTEKTYAEFIRLAKEEPPLVTEGFWGLAVELKEDKGMRLGLTTNTVRSVTDELLKLYGLQNSVFELHICGDDVKHVKPHPEMYKTAVKKMGVKKKEVLVFEDSIAGATASHKAKLDTIVIWNGDKPESDYPKSMIGFITDFTPLEGNLDTTLPEIVDQHVKSLNEKLARLDSGTPPPQPPQEEPPSEQPTQG